MTIPNTIPRPNIHRKHRSNLYMRLKKLRYFAQTTILAAIHVFLLRLIINGNKGKFCSCKFSMWEIPWLSTFSMTRTNLGLMTCQTISNHTTCTNIIPYISHKTIPCHNIPHHTTPYHATPCQKALYHTNDILNHTISHKTIRYDYYDTIPYHKNSMHDNFFSPST